MRRRASVVRRRGGRDARAYRTAAQRHLRRFQQGSMLAVAIAALLLLIWGAPVDVDGQEVAQEPVTAEEPVATDEPLAPVSDPSAAVDEATGTIRDLAYNFYGFLPRLLLALLILAFVMALVRVASMVLERTLRGWERTAAILALTRLVAFLVATVAIVSVLAGDVRAVVGSVGLLGLAASWALQTPIESFTGWLLNTFRGYYRVGDRIAVGDVFGDVFRIDVLTTTVWEAGGAGKPVGAAQATGALITVPNWEVLRSNIVNYSRDFPHVWDEVTFSVANESDLGYCAEVFQRTARRVLGEPMETAAQKYDQLLRAARLDFAVEEVPRVYFSLAESWTDCTIRYLVPVRTRRHWSSTLILEMSREMARPQHRGRLIPVYRRTEVMLRETWDAAAPDGTGGTASERPEGPRHDTPGT